MNKMIYIYIYIYIYTETYSYIYTDNNIHMHICVCVCACEYLGNISLLIHIWLNNIDFVTWYATERKREINSPTLRCLNQQAKATCTP